MSHYNSLIANRVRRNHSGQIPIFLSTAVLIAAIFALLITGIVYAAAPVPTTPATEAKNIDVNNTQFSWTASDPPVQTYILEISKNSDMNGARSISVTGGMLYFTNNSTLDYGTPYYWRVSNGSESSPVLKFTTKAAPAQGTDNTTSSSQGSFIDTLGWPLILGVLCFLFVLLVLFMFIRRPRKKIGDEGAQARGQMRKQPPVQNQCPSCGFLNSSNRQQCISCGAPLAMSGSAPMNQQMGQMGGMQQQQQQQQPWQQPQMQQQPPQSNPMGQPPGQMGGMQQQQPWQQPQMQQQPPQSNPMGQPPGQMGGMQQQQLWQQPQVQQQPPQSNPMGQPPGQMGGMQQQQPWQQPQVQQQPPQQFSQQGGFNKIPNNIVGQVNIPQMGQQFGGMQQPAQGSTSCPSCGSPAVPGKAFCGNCGARIPAAQQQFQNQQQTQQNIICPSCGSPNPLNLQFCGTCGSSLAGAHQRQIIQTTQSFACPTCGYQVNAGMNPCPGCGTWLEWGP
jgi:hypothetical protein